MSINEEIRSRVTYSVVLPRLAPETIQAFILAQLDRASLGHNTFSQIGRDWTARRKKHDWWTPWSPDWTREWESFLQTLQEGGTLIHSSSHANGWPEGATEEGYVIMRDVVQVRVIYWVGEQSDHSKTT